MPEGSPRYRDSFAASLSTALAGALILATIDLVVTSSRGGGGGQEILFTLALFAVVGLVTGAALGLVTGAWQQTFGPAAAPEIFRRLGRDRALDARVCGGILAGMVVALLFVVFSAAAAMALVADVQRKSTGALLLGLVLVAALPPLAALGLPMYRVTRLVAPHLRLGRLPAAIVCTGGAALAALLLGVFFVFTRLDWRALNLGTYALALAYPLVLLGWAALWWGPLARLRVRIPRVAALAAVLIAVALSSFTLRTDPSPEAVSNLTEKSLGARALIDVGRSLLDADGDGYSAFVGGPDCDDGNPDVHPDAREIPGNGLDDNCIGGDRAPRAAPEVVTDAPNTAARSFEFDGNVLILMIDTVRADRMGYAGYRRADRSLTPNIDALAADSVVFTRAHSQSPNTPRSWPSTITSRYPSQVKVNSEFKNFPVVLDDNLTLFEALSEAGLHTASYSSHFYFKPERNVGQGIDVYDNEGAKDIAGSNKDIAAPRIVPRAIAKIEEMAARKQRFAMFVHLFEPHSTYVEHEEFPITERGIPGLIEKYDYEIAYTDIWVGKLVEALRASGQYDDTMIVILSDHGEAFGVHRVAGKKMFFHGQTLYQELLHVPLLVRIPGVEPATIDDVVMLLDVAPTILDAMGVKVPESFIGRSLLGRMLGDPLPPEPAFAELLPAPSWNHAAKAMVTGDGRFKLYYRSSDGRFELYDLSKDPEETNDLWDSEPEIGARLREQLVEWMEVELTR